MGRGALIAAKYDIVSVWKVGGGCWYGCVWVWVWVGVGVIVWVRKGLCGWDSLDYCHKV